ncbi:MAG: hypothetical protein H8E44_27100 [Planctomycetes bacterium]|nr:hypothetical protein [Planctomycetota bacterium]MBL7041138.1 hypothetical protein [Pirellulaceae bacterium]
MTSPIVLDPRRGRIPISIDARSSAPVGHAVVAQGTQYSGRHTRIADRVRKAFQPKVIEATTRPIRPFGVSLLVVLNDIAALFVLCMVILPLMLPEATEGTPFARDPVAAGTADGLGIIGLVVMVLIAAAALAVLIVGHFLWNGFNWARCVFMGFVALAIVVELLALVSTGSPVSAARMVANLLFLIVLNSRATKEFCVCKRRCG